MDTNHPGTGGLLCFVGEIARLSAMFRVNCFGSLGCPLLQMDSYTALVLGAWKGTYTICVFSRLLFLCLRRGYGDIMCLFDSEIEKSLQPESCYVQREEIHVHTWLDIRHKEYDSSVKQEQPSGTLKCFKVSESLHTCPVDANLFIGG